MSLRSAVPVLGGAPDPCDGPGSPAPLLSIEDLRVAFGGGDQAVAAVRGVSYEVYPGETLGVVGESGSGKSVTVMAALGLLTTATAATVTGRVLFEGQDLLAMSAPQRRRVLGRDIAMVFQDPVSALNPVQRIGDQIAEMIRLHEPGVSRGDARRRAVALLEMVGVPHPGVRARQYPHEFSGGMCQRAVIALAIANRPKVLIADEPTTAVDVSVQAQLLEVLRTAARETGAATVLISHDMGVVAEMADRVCVMYGGRVVETGPLARVFGHPRHPYTEGLLACIPRLGDPVARLTPIPGQPPTPYLLGKGCAFAPRCAHRSGREVCLGERPELVVVDGEGRGGVAAACHFLAEREVPGLRQAPPAAAASASASASAASAVVSSPAASAVSSSDSAVSSPAAGGEGREGGGALLEVRELSKEYPMRSGLLGRRTGAVRAVRGLSLVVRPGETVGLVGESGCGKSTTARLLMRLEEPTSGSVVFDGEEVTGASAGRLRELRRRMAMVFQDPKASLNPQLSVGANVAEPLRLAGGWSRPARRERVAELFDQVGLARHHLERRPSELSGGQRQRVAIARALALRPKLVIMDEPVSALDVSVQAQVLNLLADLKAELGLAYLFVSHDLSVVRHVSDRVAVMYLGRIVELAGRDDIFERPRHPYTQALLRSVPSAEVEVARRGRRAPLQGDPPSPLNPPEGCSFRSRCPLAEEACGREVPLLRVHDGLPGEVACHLAGAGGTGAAGGPAALSAGAGW
ncbi:dipeptide ABC transporter ATP-binding protein [Streptomyces tagetis]|uniref:ABC transporter ATP-binding protein n=1 Tax=Streptomyces tagetis TaxID=2820809 RepID=A0A940XBF7_9ACTN|nr:ABC transporter ATP-binding protein [Streptomyces sp. RG38]MBQ0827223.1 ABC transporter ATP-binding protein [Streptomyces sp. RG38]